MKFFNFIYEINLQNETVNKMGGSLYNIFKA